MSKDPIIYIDDILDSIKISREYIGNLSKDQFFNSLQIQDAVCRRLQIIGEAANALPDDFTSRYSEVPWREIVGMRNFIIHEYFRVDLDRVWDTVQKSLPELQKQLEGLKQSLE